MGHAQTFPSISISSRVEQTANTRKRSKSIHLHGPPMDHYVIHFTHNCILLYVHASYLIHWSALTPLFAPKRERRHYLPLETRNRLVLME